MLREERGLAVRKGARVFALLLATLPPSASSAARQGGRALQSTIAFNAGSTRPVTGDDGIHYGSDQPWEGGGEGGFIGGTLESFVQWWLHHDGSGDEFPLYRRLRGGNHRYRFAVHPGADYELTLRLLEPTLNGPTGRVFDVILDGEPWIEDLDLYALAGKARALDLRRHLVSTADTLDLAFLGVAGEPLIAAIALRRLTALPPTLPPVSLARAAPSWGGALLTWRSGADSLHDGYRVEVREQGASLLLEERRYLPWTVLPAGEDLRYSVFPIDAFGRDGDSVEVSGVEELTTSLLPGQSLAIDPADLIEMQLALPEKIRKPALLIAGDLERTGEVGYRGHGSLEHPKKSFKFRSDDGLVPQTYNLVSNFGDGSMLKEPLASAVMVLASVPAYSAELVRLMLNDEYAGVYTWVEDSDEEYLERVGLDPSGRSYESECNTEPQKDIERYLSCFENTQQEDLHRDDVVALLQGMVSTPPADLETWFRRELDIDLLIDYYASQVLLANDDFSGHNFILHRDRGGGPWRMLPWDVDAVLYDSTAPANLGTRDYPNNRDGWSLMLTMMLEIPSLSRRYLERLEEILDGPWTGIAQTFDSLATISVPDGLVDVAKASRERSNQYLDSIDDVWSRVQDREPALRASIDTLRPPAAVDLAINELIYDRSWNDQPGLLGPAAPRSVELHFRGRSPLRFEGIFLSDDPLAPRRWPVESDELFAGEYRLLRSPPIASGWLGLFVDEGAGLLLADSLTLPALPPGAAYGRLPDGCGRPTPLSHSSPAGRNRSARWGSLEAVVAQDLLPPQGIAEVELTLRAHWRSVEACSIAVHAYTEGGVWVREEPSDVVDFPALGPGALHSELFHIEVPSKRGRFDLAFRAVEPSGVAVDTALVSFFVLGTMPERLVINEFSAINRNGPRDEYGNRSDWVELFNPSADPIELDGLFLTDDPEDDPYRWALPERSMQPGELLVVWLDGDPGLGELHAGFKLDRDGERIALVAAGAAPDVLDRIPFGYQETDFSLGRYPDGAFNTWERFPNPSAGQPNAEPDLGPWVKPVRPAAAIRSRRRSARSRQGRSGRAHRPGRRRADRAPASAADRRPANARAHTRSRGRGR